MGGGIYLRLCVLHVSKGIQTHDGDMAILKTGSGGKEKRAALRDRSRQWPDGIIPFANLNGKS